MSKKPTKSEQYNEVLVPYGLVARFQRDPNYWEIKRGIMTVALLYSRREMGGEVTMIREIKDGKLKKLPEYPFRFRGPHRVRGIDGLIHLLQSHGFVLVAEDKKPQPETCPECGKSYYPVNDRQYECTPCKRRRKWERFCDSAK